MGKISLLDCTLRDGGYVNDWQFGRDTIRGFGNKIARTGVEFYEVGFIKGDKYNPDRAVFPDIKSFEEMITPKKKDILYVGMLDMSAPVSRDVIVPYTGTSIDGIRVIFKKDKIEEAYEYCQYIKEQGYLLFVNLVGTDAYSDEEFISTIHKFNDLDPYGIAIVDSFGVIKRKQFMRLVYLADNNMKPGIVLCYHAHNNLQQAFGNAEALVEMNLKRDVCIDACVFGMGRGAGNLNLELFAEYLNENYDTHYNIEPMLEIMDEYLGEIYRKKFWGYSLPLYLSASSGCHPNFAIYYAEKDSLSVKAFNELLKSIPVDVRAKYSKDTAEKYYREYLENYIDDRKTLEKLRDVFLDKDIIILAPGYSILEHRERIMDMRKDNSVLIALNFLAEDFQPDFIFSSNMRRYRNIQGKTMAKCIITSNMRECVNADFIVNYSSCISETSEIVDNSGLMFLRLLIELGVKSVKLAGMDGYSALGSRGNYVSGPLEYDFAESVERRNKAISKDLSEISKKIHIEYITPTTYKI